MPVLALRMDDIGASTKQFEQYTTNRWLNIGPLKDRRLFGAWGPYREMVPQEWEELFSLLQQFNARVTVAITGAWVEADSTLTPFPQKFPEEAKILKVGLKAGLVEIAGHGLTHCVVSNGKFLPRFFGSNRSFHREFWDWVPAETHFRSVKKSLAILEDYFGEKIVTYVPPGNVYTSSTLEACKENGILHVNCNNPKIALPANGPRIIGNENVLPFHDREIVLHGISWLKNKLETSEPGTQFSFVRDL